MFLFPSCHEGRVACLRAGPHLLGYSPIENIDSIKPRFLIVK